MKKISFIIIILFSITFKINAQEIEIDSIKLAGLCKVWGLAKNYSNSVIRKKIDWDNILIKKYPEFEKSNDFNNYNQQILDLLNYLQKQKYKKEVTQKEFDLIINNQIKELDNFSFLKDTLKYKNRISFSWINDEIFTDSVKNVLCNIIINYKPQKNKYLKGKIVVKHKENDFLELDSISEPYRILGIFRYWNIINYYFPYKHLMDKKWDSVLVEHINSIKNANNYTNYIKEFRRFESNINDSHGFYNYSTYKYYNTDNKTNDTQESLKKSGYIPYNFKIVNKTVIISKVLTDSTCIKLGDTVLAINNIDLKNYIKTYSEYNSSSTLQSTKMNIEYSLSRFYNSIFNLKIKNNNDTINYTENKIVDYNTKTESFYRKPPFHYSVNDSIGYIELTQIKLKEFNKTWKEFKNKKTIIFDLRGYPETPVWLLLPYLLNKNRKIIAEYYYPDKKYPGIFINDKKISTARLWFVKPFVGLKKKYNGKTIVLINADAISQSETACMMFKAYSDKVTFIGEPTSGANGDVVKIDIPGGIYFYYSSIDWHFPNGEQLQRKGIIPDIKVKQDVESIINNEDKILKMAIEYATTKY